MPDVKLGDDSFHYESAGRGEAVVFIPGMGGDHADFRLQVPSHSRHFRCVTFDPRGAGRSAGAFRDPGAYGIELLASDVGRLMDALGIRRAHIVGVSMGGVVAQRFALDHPDRLLSLSLHSTFARTGPLQRIAFETQILLAGKLDVADVLASLAPLVWSEYTLVHRRDVIERFRESRRRHGVPIGREVYSLQARALCRVDLLPLLGSISVPTLITAGARDLLVPAAASRAIHRAVPGSGYHEFRNCGHAPLVENARGFNTVSLRFLRARRDTKEKT